MKELHDRDIVHLDIKLDNILMSSKGTYKIGDLGFVRLMNTLHGDNVPEGDSWYLALELLSNDPNAELPDLKKADIFAFGILLYELIEGRRVA